MFPHPPVRLVAIAVAGALALTGCGGDSASSGTPAAATRTITDATGAQLTVPTQPKNVVALAETDLDAAIALGVTPVGASKSRQGDSVAGYLAGKVPGVKLVGEITEPDPEAIAALNPKPDLILYGHFLPPDPAQLKDLNAIAPTVVTSLVADDWKKSLKGVADALNLEAKGTEVLASYDKQLGEVKTAVAPRASAKVSLVRWNPQGPSYLQKQHFASTVVAELGLARPAGQLTEGTGPSQPVSLEKLDVLDGDYLFLGTLNNDGVAALAQAEKNPAWNKLAVVAGKKVVTVDGVPWTSRGGPVAAGIVLDDVRKALTAG
ncbi:ABC transporter substrate-binding protein [Pilimelia anulata]|uniref:ABC transporter substrate-binding protein n=1 Tax=Pilimelia anulata TaxID=53371 RepID=A0A8J3B8Y9_9ACTN|nr:iron-siderophore ABC transporter substrate-binding protein [Pilimelia anulata]GGK04052.1 ABC transporter substrate-binding protein [Pilimelia anulata]